MDNFIVCKFYWFGFVGYVFKFGGMFNEFNNIFLYIINGVYEGVVIGGDWYFGIFFIDYFFWYEVDFECKMFFFLGEVGGIEEYWVIEVVKKGIIKKFIIVWVIGICVKMFIFEV